MQAYDRLESRIAGHQVEEAKRQALLRQWEQNVEVGKSRRKELSQSAGDRKGGSWSTVLGRSTFFL